MKRVTLSLIKQSVEEHRHITRLSMQVTQNDKEQC